MEYGIGQNRLIIEIINNFFEELCCKNEQKGRIVARGEYGVIRYFGLVLKFHQ